MKLHKNLLFAVIGIAALFMLGMPDAFAQTVPSGNGLDAIATRGAATGNALVDALRVFAIVIGIGLIIGGVLALVKDAKAQGNGPVSKGAAAIMIICGGALTFVTLLVQSTGETVWGSTSGGRDKIQITQ